MNKNILNQNIQAYISNHLNDDLKQLALDGIQLEGVSSIEVLDQIQVKNKAKNKLPEWYMASEIYYPPKVNLEQTSSSITAEYKASLISGDSLIDITGGFGVDSYFFSKRFNSVTHCEINKELSEIASYNFNILNRINTSFITQDGLEYLEKNENLDFDWIYLDPARRDGHNHKVFQLKDTSPNILYHLDNLYRHSNNIMLKTSPLLDISLGIKHLESVVEVHIVGVNNEVKELLWIIEKGARNAVKIKTININKSQIEKFDFNFIRENEIKSNFAFPLKYLYEPNACIMKSGGFSCLSEAYNMSKLHVNSHLYTSDELVEFPGRVFEIKEIIPYNKKTVRKKFGKQKHNITTRNFTLKVSDIRHLFQIEDGGDSYLFFTTNQEGKKIIIACKKINQ